MKPLSHARVHITVIISCSTELQELTCYFAYKDEARLTHNTVTGHMCNRNCFVVGFSILTP